MYVMLILDETKKNIILYDSKYSYVFLKILKTFSKKLINCDMK